MELTQMIRSMLVPARPVLDSAMVDDDDAQSYALTNIAITAAAAVQEWVETADDDLDDGETLAARLFGMLAGIPDPDDESELNPDEQSALDIALEAAWDYLSAKGVADDDAGALLNDWDNDAAMRIRDLLASSLPDGDGAMDDIDDFAFDSSATMDAVFKLKKSSGAGRVTKHVTGAVTRTPKQKLAFRKAHKKAHNATATMKRVKSSRKAKSMSA